MNPDLSTLFLLAEWSVRLVMFVVVVLRKRSPSSALLWLVVVAFLPFVGTVAYFLVGENRLGRRRRVEYQQVEELLRHSPRLVEQYRRASRPLYREPHRTLAALAEGVGASLPLGGNGVELLGDADEFLDALVEDIDHARHHCHLLYYIVQEDPRSERVFGSLLRARSRGVSCRFLVDAAGSRRFLESRSARRLRKAGVRLVAFMPVSPLRATVARLDLRNHRKVAVVDGRVGVVGSHNLSSPIYRGREAYGEWVDASLRVTGPVVHELQEVFLHDWSFAAGTLATDEAFFPPHIGAEPGAVAAVLPTGPGSPGTPLMDLVLQALGSARERCVLTTPYFVPDDALLSALRSAALRGVEVVLLVPRRGDRWVVQAAGRSHYGALMEVGVRIHEHTAGVLHAKTLTMDREFAVVGTANLDVRSFSLNFEVGLLVFDSDVSSRLHYLQTEYLDRSRRLTMAEWEDRGGTRVLGDNVAKLLTPLL